MNLWRYLIFMIAGAIGVTGIFVARHRSHEVQSAACLQTGSCRPSYRNTAVCEQLGIGTTERELTLRLGQPIDSKDQRLFFQPGATEHGPIEVELDPSRRATRFFCHGRS